MGRKSTARATEIPPKLMKLYLVKVAGEPSPLRVVAFAYRQYGETDTDAILAFIDEEENEIAAFKNWEWVASENFFQGQ